MINPKDMKRVMNSPYRLLAPVERLLLEDNDKKSGERDKLHLHPSEICKKDWCPRSSYYKITGHEEKVESFTLQRLNIFATGTQIHEKWQDWLTRAGVLESAEVPIFDEEHMIMGHADGVVSDKKGRAVLEIKSVGIGTVRFENYELFSKYAKKEIGFDDVWALIKEPFPSHVRQAQLYMYCLGIEDGLILYEWKATQDVKEFAIKYQPEIVDPILASCLSVVRALRDKVAPERPMWLSPDHRVCKYCPFKAECWDNENGNNGQQGTDGGQVNGTDPRWSFQVSVEVQPSRETDGRRTDAPRQSRRVTRQ